MRELDVPVQDYRRELDIACGVHRVRYSYRDRAFERECFLSYPDRVFALRYQGNRARLTLMRGHYVNRLQAADERTLILSGKTGDGGVGYAVMCRGIGEGVRAVGSTLLLPEECTLLVAAATTFRCENPEEEVLSRLAEAQRLGYERLKERHTADVRELMERCVLEIHGSAAESAGTRESHSPDEAKGEMPGEALDDLATDERLRRFCAGGEDFGLISTYFAYGRYLLIAS